MELTTMIRTYPIHSAPRRRPESLRDIFRRLEREIAEQAPPQRPVQQLARPLSGFPFR